MNLIDRTGSNLDGRGPQPLAQTSGSPQPEVAAPVSESSPASPPVSADSQPGVVAAGGAGFTPGPWHCAGGRYIGIIATINGGPAQIGRAESFGHISDSECEANAALIAAAPDLLVALSAVLAEWDETCRELEEVGGGYGFRKATLDKARAAIAKAEGTVQP